MRGSGSEYLASCANLMALDKGMLALSVLNIKFKVPLSTASIFKIVSPELIRLLMVLMMGKPAPTLVSKRNLMPFLRARFLSVM